ncbi:mediator of RNA polymerase II transcription subunit 17-like isoform X2 [Patiria miniata]|uniref:Mediator of RNA polymerase II transcription subunit 17 n=1 Tax=Patiria miniata TaxID=46514 RepID=A0A913Z2M4_PATMI|nr:mediator of RNA polymerase II transcription subunit 17-like isoform X2 [Patiria miniata]
MDSVTVSIESLQEFQVQEVSLDGQETYTKPLSMSESLAKLAHKIDFTKPEGEEIDGALADEDKDTKKADVKEESPAVQAVQWPWESVHSKLRCALTEISVLSDILHICRWAKDPRYMVLDPVSQEPTQSKQIIQLLDKKKSLGVAASVLKSGANRMMRQPLNATTASPQKSQHQNDFHADLLRLRQHWRLKKVGSNILGDLSFRTAGSRFWHNGTFEVTKITDVDCDATEKKNVTPLKVTIPSDIEGTSHIQVLIQEGEAEIATASLSQPSRSRVSADAHWQERLEAAQTVLFCKEVFAQIAREAVQLRSPVPHIVVGNQIFCTLFPGVRLCLALCHNTSMDSQVGTQSYRTGLKCRYHLGYQIEPLRQPNHSHALEHSLHQLLRELHRSNLSGTTPRPITASLTVSKKRRLAGPQAISRKELTDSQQGECLLEKVLKQAKHIVLRKRVADVINQLSSDLQDPVILVHWSAHTQPLVSTAKIHISTSGYEQMAMILLQLTVEVDQIRVLCKDGRVIHANYEQQQLKDLLRCQISQHQIACVFSLSKSMNMHVLHYNLHLGVGSASKLGNASSVLISTHHGQRTLAVRSDPLNGIRVQVKGCKNPHDTEQKSNVVTDPKWETIMTDYREVDMDRIPGRTFVNKMELLMAVLAS